MRRILTASLLASLAACSDLTAAQQAQVQQAVTVICRVDGTLVPVAQPVVTSTGPGGAAAANTDALLVHPAVVAACQALNGTPVGVMPVNRPATGPVAASPAG